MKIHVIPICDISSEQKMRIKKLGHVKFFKKTVINDQDFLNKCIGADILMMPPRPPIDPIPYLKQCKFISLFSTGYDAIDIHLARKKGILISNVPAYATDSVAEHIFAMILNLTKNIKRADEIVRKNLWNAELMVKSVELFGKTFGIFGFGKIGCRAAEIAKSFGMKVIAHTRENNNNHAGIDFVSFEKLLNDSDFIVLAAPLTKETFHKFGEKEFRAMKKKPIFINTARGAIVNEKALIKAIKNKWISGAGLDVFEKEPLAKNHPFCRFNNVILTPHVAWGSEEAVEKLVDIAIDNVKAFLQGRPKNIVNLPSKM